MTRSLTLIILFVSLFFFSLKSQNSAELTDNYSRSAITLKLLGLKDGKYRDKIRKEFVKYDVPEKFDNNNVDSKILKTTLSEFASTEQKKAAIIAQLKKEKTGSAIIAKWFNRQPDGSMNTELIHKRGLYNAVDDDVYTAEASKRGQAMLMDMGMKLLSKSYIVVIDYEEIRSAKDLKYDEKRGWTTPLSVYLFRVKYNQEIENKLFGEMWIYDSDDAATRQIKKEKFDQFTFDIEFIDKFSNPGDLSRMQNKNKKGIMVLTEKSEEQLFEELVQKGFERSFFLLEKKHEDFRVKTPLVNDDPLEAKIGSKEGLKVDQRYFVYEFKYNKKKDKTIPSRRGVVRAQKVINNSQVASGASPVSPFYQISGRKLETGMLMQQRSDWGIGVQGRYGMGEIGGGGVKVTYNTARYIGITQMKLYGYASLDPLKTYEIDEKYFASSITEFEYDFTFTRIGAGLAKGFYFGRLFSIEPFIGVSYESASNSDLTYADMALYSKNKTLLDNADDDIDINVLMYDAGFDFGINIVYWMKLVAGVELHLVSNIIDTDADEYLLGNEDGSTIRYNEFFVGRQGLTLNFGLNIEF
ncbi:MAG: hypothetical protein C0599_08155 [Salinivirgaceae bacterium]|nr:MAG: hypothetical protein C0599_08155 [Salinivirgaceae bacterium]